MLIAAYFSRGNVLKNVMKRNVIESCSFQGYDLKQFSEKVLLIANSRGNVLKHVMKKFFIESCSFQGTCSKFIISY